MNKSSGSVFINIVDKFFDYRIVCSKLLSFFKAILASLSIVKSTSIFFFGYSFLIASSIYPICSHEAYPEKILENRNSSYFLPAIPNQTISFLFHQHLVSEATGDFWHLQCLEAHRYEAVLRNLPSHLQYSC